MNDNAVTSPPDSLTDALPDLMGLIPAAPAPILSIIEGDLLYCGSADDLRAMGVADTLIAEAEAALLAARQREALRLDIERRAGDVPSLLGTTADGAQLALYAIAMLVHRLESATSLAEVRAAAAPFAPVASRFLARVDSGAVKLPFLLKGIETVTADIEARATAVADVMLAASAQAATVQAAMGNQADS